MNVSRQGPFNVEMLENLVYKRSKIWANLMNTMTNDHEQELSLSDVSAVFADEKDEDDDAVNLSEEAEVLDVFDDDEVLHDITNRSRAIAKYNCSVRNLGDEAEDDEEGENGIGEGSLKEFLDQTMPVLNEHKRKWQEAGLERVLNTFDAQKIEEKVGGWLRRNQSGQSLDASGCTPFVGAHKASAKKLYTLRSDSETESMHSVDTARYILSSRKNRRMGTSAATSSSCTTTMTIKTFRLVQSKRAAADTLASDEAHLSELRCRRAQRYRHQQQQQQQQQQQSSGCGSAELLRLAAESRSIKRRSHPRRKQLRKRRSSATTHSSTSSSSSFDSSASVASSDEVAASASYKCRRKLSRSQMRCQSKRYVDHHQEQKKQQQQQHSLSSSSSSLISTRKLRHIGRKMKSLWSDHDDLRPCKRESECRCCNEAKLCDEIRHLADTSTEDWLVENCNTPKKSFPVASTETERHKRIKAPKFSAAKPKANKKETSTKMGTEKHSFKQIPEEAFEENERNRLKSKKSKKEADPTNERTAKHTLKQIPEEAFEENERNRLKPTYERTAKLTKEPPTKTKIPKLIEKSKSKKTVNTRKEDVIALSSDDSFDRELQAAIEISKKTFKQEQQPPKSKEPMLSEKTKPLEKPSKRLKGETERKHAINKSERKEKTTNATENSELLPTKQPLDLLSRAENENTNNLEKAEANSSPEKLLKPQPKSLKLRKLAKMQSKSQANSLNSAEEESFFGHSRNFCNSTVVCNDTAAAPHQFSSERNKTENISSRSDQRTIKCMAAVSSTNSNGAPSTSTTESTNHFKDDCTVVSSTTEDPQQKQQQPQAHSSHKGILLYTPEQRTMVPAHSFINGNFNITEEHLSNIIGAKPAQKFLKYYLGRRRFDSNSTIYFRPPPAIDSVHNSEAGDTDESDDTLECVGQYGELYESLNKDGIPPH